jgi:DNA-binding transcriptional ArsR family regulator
LPRCGSGAIFNSLIEYRNTTLDRTFAALAHHTRRAIVRQLSDGPLTVTEVAAPHPISLAAVSKHLDVLEEAGLVRRTREGRVQRCSLQSEPLAETARWVEQYRGFWELQLGALSRYLAARRRRS